MNNPLRYTAGATVGALLALGLVGEGFQRGMLFPEQKPQVKVNVVRKEWPVIQKVTVIKRVVVKKEVMKVKAYRVSVLDDSGRVVETYNNISTFQFRIIGAILTDKAGKTFSVDRNIS